MMDEDELLSGPFTVDELQSGEEPVDEELLLGRTSRTATMDFVPESENRGEDSALTTKNADPDESFEREELDYDEDEDDEKDKEERTGRFTSERKKEAAKATPSETNVNGQQQPHKTWNRQGKGYQGQQRFRGGAHQGNFGSRQMRGRGGNVAKTGPPSIMSLPSSMGPPGGKILINPNFRGNIPPPGATPLVQLRLPGGPAMSLPSIGRGPPSILSSVIAGPVGPIVPRLPNGIPLTGLPPNHGVAGFGPPAPRSSPSMPRGAHGGPGSIGGFMRPSGGHWDQAVEAFLSQSTGSKRSPKRRRRSSSYSSYSSYSSRSKSSGSSRSRSPRRKHRERRESRRWRGGRDGQRRGRGQYRGRGGPMRREDSGRRDRKGDKNEKEVTMECAKAIGLDNDYMSKMEEQKRKRDEIMRKKEQRRFGTSKRDASSIKSGESKDRKNPTPSTSATSDSAQKSQLKDVDKDSTLKKSKAYLCVNVRNVKQLPTAKIRVETLAKDLGEIRKCWQTGEDQVTIIFVEHDKAKQFMLKYNNKVLSGLRINVGLEKSYLNLAEVTS